jgi:hypothetical protein
MIPCAKCQQPISLHSSVTRKFPMHVSRICDDCVLVIDHFNEPDAAANETWAARASITEITTDMAMPRMNAG